VTTDEAPILSISEYLELVNMALTEQFGRSFPYWIRGEIQKVSEPKHLYLDVVDEAGSLLRVKCWQSTWSGIKAQLGVPLKAGTVITFRAHADIYKPRGDFSVTMTHLNVGELQGDADRKREELIRTLRAEGVLQPVDYEAPPLPPIPLRVGLVASRNTEGCNDFLGQLEKSGMSIAVSLISTVVQGDSAPPAIVAALRTLATLDLDVIALVRGGGSKADLQCFDDETIARAIHESPIPVLTGIGHTGDIAIADLAAFRSFPTPTAVGTAIGRTVQAFHDRWVVVPSERLERAARAVVDEAEALVRTSRRELLAGARAKLHAEQMALANAGRQLLREARSVVEHADGSLKAASDLLRAHDPQRRLAQGWSITTRADGAVVRSVDDVRLGEALTVRVADGTVDVTVDERHKKVVTE
jgi:exodeoxyribonuclease VII large subunit